jgi:hypothetical protein
MSTPIELYKDGKEEERKKWEEEHKPVHDAVRIDEASMGEPWSEFGKWFVDKFYHGYSMMEVLLASQRPGGSQEMIDEMQAEIHDNTFTEFDYKTVCDAMDQMQCYADMDKEKVKAYLKLCIGKAISTENW